MPDATNETTVDMSDPTIRFAHCDCGGRLFYDDVRGVAHCYDCGSHERYTPRTSVQDDKGALKTTDPLIDTIEQRIAAKQTALARVSQAIFGCPENASREDIARAAVLATLDAIREPTAGMLKAGACGCDYCLSTEDNAKYAWSEMIDALAVQV